MAVLVGTGEQMAERFLPLYLVALGSGMVWPGTLQAVHNLVGALYSYPGGWLAERLGEKRALLVFDGIAIAGYVLVLAVPRWEVAIVGSLLFLSWSAVSLPPTMGLIAKTLPKTMHVMGVSVNSLVRRLPKALGPLLGGVFLDRYGLEVGMRVAFACALTMALVAAVLQHVLIADDAPRSAGERPDAHPLRMFRSFSPALRNLFVADVLIRFCEQIPYAYVTIWCVHEVVGHATARVSASVFGVLTAIEMATAVLCYVPVARWADRAGKKPFVLATFVAFTIFPAVLWWSRDVPMLVVAFVVRGLKEFGEPTRKALILQLAPEGRQATAFGTYYLFRDTTIAVAAGLGALLWSFGPAVTLWSAFGFGVAGTLWFWRYGRSC